MTAQVSRAEAVRILEEGREAVSALTDPLTEEDLARPATIGGGEWSAKDLLGHLAFWQELGLRSLSEWRAGEPYSFESEFETKGADGLNAENYVAKAALSTEAIKESAARVADELVDAIQAMTDGEWSTPVGEGSWGSELGGIMGGPAGPFRHVEAHLDDLRAFVESL